MYQYALGGHIVYVREINMSELETVSLDSGEEEDDMLLLGGALWFLYLRRKERAQRSIWCREWLLRRDDLGAYETLIKELREEDKKSFINFLRVSPGIFEGLLEKVAPLIQKQDTNYRKAIKPGMRLAITLRYLATGEF